MPASLPLEAYGNDDVVGSGVVVAELLHYFGSAQVYGGIGVVEFDGLVDVVFGQSVVVFLDGHQRQADERFD